MTAAEIVSTATILCGAVALWAMLELHDWTAFGAVVMMIVLGEVALSWLLAP